MSHLSWITIAVFVVDLAIRLGLSVRVIMRRRPVGVSLAWLTVILIFPIFGALVYLMIGELRLGRRRADRAARIHALYLSWLDELRARAHVDWSASGMACEPLARLAESAVGIPALPNNSLELLIDAPDVFRRMGADIDAARSTCHLEFYIWSAG